MLPNKVNHTRLPPVPLHPLPRWQAVRFVCRKPELVPPPSPVPNPVINDGVSCITYGGYDYRMYTTDAKMLKTWKVRAHTHTHMCRTVRTAHLRIRAHVLQPGVCTTYQRYQVGRLPCAACAYSAPVLTGAGPLCMTHFTSGHQYSLHALPCCTLCPNSHTDLPAPPPPSNPY